MALPFPPLELLSKDEFESIHQAALTVLKEIGVDFRHRAGVVRDAGTKVDSNSEAPGRDELRDA